MLYDDLRSIHEDLERLESGIADRISEDHKHSVGSILDTCELQQGSQLTDSCQTTT
jgi:hypothetical protein